MVFDANVQVPILQSLRETLLTRMPFDAIPESVWMRTGALNTWGTNAIEGNTLTRRDVERLLLERRSVANRPVPDVLETLQHEAAFRSLMDRRSAPLNGGTALDLHRTVFQGVLPAAGTWRRVNVGITGARFTPPRMEKVESSMDEWEKEYARRDLRAADVFALAAWMHFQFETIHPFEDGNGRVGRLLLNLHFLRHNWPPVHVLPPDRTRYLKALDAGHSSGLEVLEEFLRVAMARSLLDLLDQVGTEDDRLLSAKKLDRRGPYSAKYLALRMSQGKLPGLKVSGDWRTSPRALRAYVRVVARGSRVG
jgi:Fic family protein